MVYGGFALITVSGAYGAYTAALDYSSLAECAASWSSYDALISAAITYVPVTNTSYTAITTNLTYGAGNVYTTSAGIPVASGSFTPTKVVQTVYNVISLETDLLTSTRQLSQSSGTPSCSSLAPPDCSRLYVSYISSLGLPPSADVPKITPPPQNSPRCPDYHYKPFSTCSYFTDDVATCFLWGNSVEVFFFPYQEPQKQTGTITRHVIQSYAPGITFTSPSIYLSFDFLSAISTLAAQQYVCTTCGWEGCTADGVGGGNGVESRGTSIAGALLTMAPEDVSTLLVQFPPTQVSSIINVIAKGLPDFAKWSDDINYVNNFSAKRLNLDHFTRPSPEDYYLRPEGAPGCNESVPSPMCSTIFEAMYRPILSLPSQVSLLQGEWATCQPAIYGVYDPPKALTEVATIEGVPGYTVSAAPAPSAITTPRNPTSPWQSVFPPTKIPDELPNSSTANDQTSSPSPSSSPSVSIPTTQPTSTGLSLASGILGDPVAALVIAMIGVMVLL